MENGDTFLNDELIKDLQIDNDYIEKERCKQLEEIKRRKTLYRNSEEKGLDIGNKIVILVDDGAAPSTNTLPRDLKLASPVTRVTILVF
jgi:predicted phosphoribosyltransferase